LPLSLHHIYNAALQNDRIIHFRKHLSLSMIFDKRLFNPHDNPCRLRHPFALLYIKCGDI
jgi:hypothetical protein